MVCQPDLSVSDVQQKSKYIKMSKCCLIYIAIALKSCIHVLILPGTVFF